MGAAGTADPKGRSMSVSVTHRRMAVNESVVCAELDDEAVLLDVETGIYYGLDTVGTRIWNLLAQGAASQQILDHLLVEYDVDPDRLQADLSAFMSLLETKGLTRTAED
jgi:hypothetical protein